MAGFLTEIRRSTREHSNEEYILYFIQIPLIEKVGRRPLLIYPMCGMVVSFIFLTICLHFLKNPAYAISVTALFLQKQNSCVSFLQVCQVDI